MKRHHWTKQEIAALRRRYPSTYTRTLVAACKHPLSSIYYMARRLGLKKSAAFLEAERGRQGRLLARASAAHRFPKGHVPVNKGLRRPGWGPGRMKETQFKKGQISKRWDPELYLIGALRVNTDGYVKMKVCNAPGARAWRSLHVILWEDEHGPVPKGHCLTFRDRDSLNVCLENIELITRADNMRRNAIHNLPKPLADTIKLLGHLKRRIREKQDSRSA